MKANPLTDDVKITVRKPESEATFAASDGSTSPDIGARATLVWLELTKEQKSHCTIADVIDVLVALEKAMRRLPVR